MNSFDWGGFPGEPDDDDYDEAREQDAYDDARHVISDDGWNKLKEEW